MHHIVYISAASLFLQENDLQDILNVARNRNVADGITGMLMFHQNQFLQVLEGERDLVTACFDRIKQDTRHSGIIKLYDESGQERIFTQWHMGTINFEGCQKGLQGQLVDLFEITGHPNYPDLRKNKVISIFVDTFLADLHALKSGFKAA